MTSRALDTTADAVLATPPNREDWSAELSATIADESLQIRPKWAEQDPILAAYYDTEWGVPVTDEQGVFERLSLEAFQAGLSWRTILMRRDGFRAAFAQFDVDTVAGYTDTDVERLMGDERIIRNHAKIVATIGNAQAALRLREVGTDLAEVVWSFMPERSPAPRFDAEVPATSDESRALARELKAHGFAFVGPTTAYALMTAIGIVDAHLVASPRRGCSGLWNVDGSRAD